MQGFCCNKGARWSAGCPTILLHSVGGLCRQPTGFLRRCVRHFHPCHAPCQAPVGNHLFPVRSAEAIRNDEKVSGRDAQDLRAVAPRRGTPCRPRRDGKRADRQDTTTPSTRPDLNPNPPARPRAGPPPRLSSGRPALPSPACTAAPSVSPWRAAATAPPSPPDGRPRGAAHSLLPDVVRNNAICRPLDERPPRCDKTRSHNSCRRGRLGPLVRGTPRLHRLSRLTCTLLTRLADAARFLPLCLRSPTALAADNLLLRHPLALEPARQVTPRRATHTTRGALAGRSSWCDWRPALGLVQPATRLQWHRPGSRLGGRGASRAGRPSMPADRHALRRRLALAHPPWSQERLAQARWRTRGLRGSPRPGRPSRPPRRAPGRGPRGSSPRWATGVHPQAQAVGAWDGCVVGTAPWRRLSGCGRMAHAPRRGRPRHVPGHPPAPWPLPHRRAAIPAAHTERVLLHARDRLVAQPLAPRLRHRTLRGLKPPPPPPPANALGARLRDTLRQEGVACVRPLPERPLRRLRHAGGPHENAGRPHLSLGPGIPQPPVSLPAPLQTTRHRLPPPVRVSARSMLGG